jgi:hypothetical protein
MSRRDEFSVPWIMLKDIQSEQDAHSFSSWKAGIE